MTNGAAKPAGIMPRKYKSGSIIYFENDKSEYIYILKSGRVVLTSVKIDTGEEVKEEVRQGEFFGVKSSLGKYPREETAQTIGDTVVLVMSLADFERLILRNVNVVRKMLRVFSNQLRRINKMNRSVLGEGDTVNLEEELFRIGEYYYKEGVFQQAQYAFKKYMEYYPDAQYARTAMERIKAIDSGIANPTDANIDFSPPPPSGAQESGLDDFTFDDAGGGGDDMMDFEDSGGGMDDMMDYDGGSGGDSSSLSNEMDDFLTGSSSQGFDDFSFDEPAAGGGNTIFEINSKASDAFSSGNYSGALNHYASIMKMSGIHNDEEKRIFEKAHYEAGRCQMEMGKLKEAIELFSKILKDFPGSEYLKHSIYNIGLIFESINQKDKAITYFNKVLNMSPKDELNSQALSKIKNLQG